MQNKVADSQQNTTHRLPSRYKLRCKSIPRKYLDRKGCVYGITWSDVAGRTLDVMKVVRSKDGEICSVYTMCYIFSIGSDSKYNSKHYKISYELIKKYTELWAVYPGYKRRVW